MRFLILKLKKCKKKRFYVYAMHQRLQTIQLYELITPTNFSTPTAPICRETELTCEQARKPVQKAASTAWPSMIQLCMPLSCKAEP